MAPAGHEVPACREVLRWARQSRSGAWAGRPRGPGRGNRTPRASGGHDEPPS